MKLLVDTHLLLWAAYASDRLPPKARAFLEDESNLPLFSAASVWEVSIKSALGRPNFAVSPSVFRRGLKESGYHELEVTGAHAVAVADLPPVHRDPFDRMLVAQARVEGLTLLTADTRVADYGAPVVLT